MNSYDNITLVVPRPSSGLDPHKPVLASSTIPKTLPPDHVVVRVDRFGFSSNNITYQALGEEPHFKYFDFHPAPKTSASAPEVHGVVPVWGFGTVVASNVSKIRVNERIFGYLGMAQYLLLPVDTTDINQFNFYVPRPHLPSDRRPYNQLTRCSHDQLYHPAEEDLAMLYRPLFWTSFWAEDWLFTAPAKPYNGAATVLISSASAKTAFCLAYLVQKRKHSGVKVVGLTSKGNLTFTKGLGLYDVVLTYDDVESSLGTAGNNGTWIYVDVAGNDTLNGRIGYTLGDRVVRNVSLGVTNLSPAVESNYVMPTSGVTHSEPSNTSAKSDSVPAVEFFFMPEWLSERRRALAASGIFAMQQKAWTALMRDCTSWPASKGPWVTMERSWGAEDVLRKYGETVKGRVGPDKGMVWSLWGEREGGKWENEVLQGEAVKGKL